MTIIVGDSLLLVKFIAFLAKSLANDKYVFSISGKTSHLISSSGTGHGLEKEDREHELDRWIWVDSHRIALFMDL